MTQERIERSYAWPKLEQVDRRSTIWHYTDASGVLGILRFNRVWATAANMLNDSAEMSYGLDLAADMAVSEFAQQVVEMVRELLIKNDVYVSCASLDGDSLAQWRGYAGVAGYAIGLRAAPLRVVVQDPDQYEQAKGSVIPTGWLKVVYTLSEQKDLLRRFWSTLDEAAVAEGESAELAEAAARALAGLVVGFKHQGFSSELEVRLAYDSAAAGYPVAFRSAANGLTPYIQVAYRHTRGRNVGVMLEADESPLPVKAVRVGPQPNIETAANGLRRFLDAEGHSNAVLLSEVPFR